MPNPIDVTLADALWLATVDHMRQMCTPHPTCGIPPCSDDHGDDWNGIIDIMRTMFDMRWEADPFDLLVDLDVYLNTPVANTVSGTVTLPACGRTVDALAFHGCDGIPQAFYDLDCPALPKDDD
jgi:hypothetical protein